ncbi:19466_t:CDS:2 [Rhizophagus irregularis]|nr:19466_t:CDS:2 [Rhizophagus irregularis]
MLPIFFITLIFTFYFSTLLWKRWQQFSVKRNRWTALRLGHSIRLFICSIMYTIFLGVSLISRIVFQYIIKNPENGIEIEDFAQPFISNNILHTTLLTIPEEKSPVDITNDDQDTIIEEIEVIV